MQKESDVEHYFVEQCKKFGYLTYKFVAPGQAGVPDRIVIDLAGVITFVEFKATINDYPRPLQFVQIEKLAGHGQDILVLRSKSEVDWVFRNENGSKPMTWQEIRDEKAGFI